MNLGRENPMEGMICFFRGRLWSRLVAVCVYRHHIVISCITIVRHCNVADSCMTFAPECVEQIDDGTPAGAHLDIIFLPKCQDCSFSCDL